MSSIPGYDPNLIMNTAMSNPLWLDYDPRNFLAKEELNELLNNTDNKSHTITIKPGGVMIINGIPFQSNGGTISLTKMLQPTGGKKKVVRKKAVKKST